MIAFFYKLFRRMNCKMRQTIFNKMIQGKQGILITTYYKHLYKKWLVLHEKIVYVSVEIYYLTKHGCIKIKNSEMVVLNVNCLSLMS